MIVEIGVDTSSSEKRLKELGDSRWEAVSVWPLLSTIRILFQTTAKIKVAQYHTALSSLTMLQQKPNIVVEQASLLTHSGPLN